MRRPPAANAERCDVCGATIEAAHDHVVDLRARALRCACRACYLLFTHEGAGGGRLRAVPKRFLRLPHLDAVRESLDALDLPIGLAFFLHNSESGRITAFYPSPAGATESELELDAWRPFAGAVPALASLACDVEAVLIRKQRDGVIEAYIVPIDASYELVGRIRRAWRGLTGGDDVIREVDAFFAHASVRADAFGPDGTGTAGSPAPAASEYAG